MRKKVLIFGTSIAIVTLAFVCARLMLWISSEPALGRVRTAVEPPDTISIFYTCDTRGHARPCNCTAGIAGGLPRRKSFISRERGGDTLIVDAGNVTAGAQPWDLMEFDYILRAYSAIGYDAVNIGKREARLSAAVLHELNGRYPYFVCANIVDDRGSPIFPAFRVITMESGYRVAVLGVLENTLPRDERGDGVLIQPPAEAIARTLPAARRESDFVVLLAFADEQTLTDFADRFFEISVIIGGDVEQPSGDAIAQNKSTIVYVTDKGKSVGRLNMRYIGGRYIAENNSITMMLDNVPDDPAIAALVDELQVKLAQNNYPTSKDDEDGLSRIR